ncbi:putative eukaryotic translation initiation factor 2C [Monocercomonoides exilis]|uniref:putative eukaryotic translation initiation factor 2C n=1 Tax=Monocercomonoides exilis TaxID=2049356 RepID=UPI0035595D48|nr:putative eukaryotic translation initiation factor 2C [Monocercomonoides exilis]|eukprot:MONOS_13368.1-p1 / transcript=MONOS_13368.1 / gene=MONOS_13368 / organism=Monocercomonoides_exilis_PA203 / gene_product=Piwi-like protein 1 / transcript_product=Piwi-like protein 1 / location=Mono_scaffold00817:23835-26901(-) / protein_length=858 / sequence_SO=supercontig / SO=protein_coding / is_pseudo=false
MITLVEKETTQMDIRFARRPSKKIALRGSRPVSLLANSYPLKIDIKMFQYSVEFTPELDRFRDRRLREGLVDQLKREHIAPIFCAFDNTSFYSYNSEIKTKDFDLPRKYNDEEKSYHIHFELVNAYLPGNPNYPFQWLNVLVKEIQAKGGYIQIRREMLDPNQIKNIPGTNLEMWFGTRLTIYPSITGVKTLVDQTHGILRTDTILEEWNRSGKSCAETLKGQFIVTKYSSKYQTFRIVIVLEDQTPLTYKFKHKNEKGEEVEETIKDYYFSRYEIRLLDCQPLLLCRSTSGTGSSKLAAIPMELAFATGIPEECLSDFRLMKTVKEMHTHSPRDRMRLINSIAQPFLESKELKDAGLEAKFKGMERILGWICPPVNLRWGDGKILTITDGAWRDATKTNTLLRPVNLEKWVIICSRRDTRNIDNFLYQLRRVAKGVHIAQPDLLEIERDYPNQFATEVDQKFTEVFRRHQLALVILPNKDTNRYKQMKIMTETRKPIPSQCVVSKNVRDANLSVLTGLWTQITHKIGGTCWAIDPPDWARPLPPTVDVPSETASSSATPSSSASASASASSSASVSASASDTSNAKRQPASKSKKGGKQMQMPALEQSVNTMRILPGDGNVMVLSIDVSRSKGRLEGTIAMIASMSRDMTRTYKRTAPCKQKKEIVGGNLWFVFLKSALDEYKAINKNLPSYIIEYRDGVGDAQLNDVVGVEYEQMLRAFSVFDEGEVKYRPRHAVIVVDKRIHHRFFTADGQNPPPGTVVDSVVTSDFYYDWFLIPQKVDYRTTALPTRYVVVVDETGLASEELINFSNCLCYNYCNYFGAISLPLPLQEAHKLSIFGQEILGNLNSKNPHRPYQY